MLQGSLALSSIEGVKKKAILGTNQIGEEPVSTSAAAATASAVAIIAAIAPIITAILNKLTQKGTQFTPAELQAMQLQNTASGTGILAWIKANPILAAGAGIALYMFVIKPMMNKKAA